MTAINNELKNIISNHRSNLSSSSNDVGIKTRNTTDAAEFKNIINSSSGSNQSEFRNLVEAPEIELSLHAQKRLEQRSIQLDGQEYAKLKLALQSLENKGGRESLVVTEKAAYIMDVANKKIVTAMNKDELRQNVFTKIDSTVFV